PSTYLYQTFLFWPQPTVGSPGLEAPPTCARAAGLVQSRAAYWAWSLAASVLPEAEGVGVAFDVEPAEGERVGEGVEPAFSASVTARPWEVAEALGDAVEDEVAFSLEEAPPEGLALGFGEEPRLEEALGDGL